MKPLHACPVCHSTQLKIIGRRDIALHHPPTSCFDGGNNVLLEYVLGTDAARTDTVQCKACRHIFLSPTFEPAELDRLYSEEAFARTKQQYRESERVSGKSWAEQNRIDPGTQSARLTAARTARPARLKTILTGLELHPESICDVGGMDGQVMSGFSGSRKFVYDKVTRNSTDDCTYLHTREDVAKAAPYDLVLFSHVLEHIPDVLEFVAPYATYLTPDGCFYFEVPLQYPGPYLKRSGIPIGAHVNYFTMPSLQRLAVETGMSEILFCDKEIVWYGELRMAALKMVCRASGRRRIPGRWWPWEVLSDTVLHLRTRIR